MAFGSKKKVEKVREFTPYPRPEVVKKEEVTVTAASYIGKTMKIEGELVSEEDLTIEGEVSGTIEVSKTLTIGENGNVSADINANVVQIVGRAKGNIVASDKVSILSRGRYTGNIHSQKLVVAEGAILIGDINKESENAGEQETNETAAEPVETTEKPVETTETTDTTETMDETMDVMETEKTDEYAEAAVTEEVVEAGEVQDSEDYETENSEETENIEETEETEETNDSEETDDSEPEGTKRKKKKRRRR